MFRLSVESMNANRRNLGLLLWLRGILVLVLMLAGLLLQVLWQYPLLSNPGLLVSLGLLTVLNLVGVIRLWKGPGRVTENELMMQLALDVGLMTAVLYFTGGSTNPVVSWFLVPVTIAATILRLQHTVIVLAMAVTAYSWLMFHFQPFSPVDGLLMAPESAMMSSHTGMMSDGGGHHLHGGVSTGGFSLHVFGMWLNFLLSAALIAFFVARMSHALREQDRVLAEQREDLQASEQLVMLGTLAASAAHELGSPLNTLKLLVDEMAADMESGAPQQQDLKVMQTQLEQCRQILQGLRQQAENAHYPTNVNLSVALEDLVRRVEVLHPACHITFACAKDYAGIEIDMPPALPPVVMNLLNNAAEAAHHRVSLRVEGNESELQVLIEDDGDGIDQEILNTLGQPQTSRKSGGLGIGLYLSHAALNRLGGTITLGNRPEGGTLSRLTVPWSVLGGRP